MIFISYRRIDTEMIKVLSLALEQFGSGSIWMDRDLCPTNEWTKSIADAVANSDIVLVVISPEQPAPQTRRPDNQFNTSQLSQFAHDTRWRTMFQSLTDHTWKVAITSINLIVPFLSGIRKRRNNPSISLENRTPTQAHARHRIKPVVLRSYEKYRALLTLERTPLEEQQTRQLGIQIRTIRMHANCSRAQLAHLLHIDTELLIALENGSGNLHTAQNILRLTGMLLAERKIFHRTG